MNLRSELDRCVMCGMCSQHCPTYALTADENESPRGRIALISALNSGQITPDASLQTHLEHCTGCRSCERMCPSGVRFGAIMDQAKTLLPTKPVTVDPDTIARLSPWLRRYQRWGLQKLTRATGVLKLLDLAQTESLLPRIPDTPAWQAYYPPTIDNHQGDVGLFTGCVSNIFDREALAASRLLLNRLGYGVHIPPTQGCCGAMHLHNGQTSEAVTLAQQNLAAFNKLDLKARSLKAIVHTASGCTAMLSEYDQLPALPEDQHPATFAGKVKDISQFLAEAVWPAGLRPEPFSKPVAIHTPCSLNNVLRQADAPRRLLQHIPGIELLDVLQTGCCGGAGAYMLTQADFARRLRNNTLDSLQALNKKKDLTTLVTSNLGCALHIAAGLREQGTDIEVLHPVVLLARQLGLRNTD